MKKWTRVMYQPNLPLEAGRYVTASKEHIALSLEAATEGMVLLKNENNILPLKNGSRITLFGRGSFDYVKGGGGSGDVTVSYVHNLYDGFKTLEDKVQVYEPVAEFYKKNVEEQYAIGRAPGMTEEPELPQELSPERDGIVPAWNTTVNSIHGRMRQACRNCPQKCIRTAIFI